MTQKESDQKSQQTSKSRWDYLQTVLYLPVLIANLNTILKSLIVGYVYCEKFLKLFYICIQMMKLGKKTLESISKKITLTLPESFLQDV